MKTNGDIKIEKIIKKNSILFFDLDGTLIDTNYANFLSYKKAIEKVIGNIDIIYNPNKRFTRNILKSVIPENIKEDDYLKIIQEKEKVYKDFLPETKLIKHIADILIKYSKTNQTVLVTNCRKNRALQTLNYHGLKDKFSNLFFRKLTTNSKKINKFENAIKTLGVNSKQIIVFENEDIEIADAKQIGIKIINPIKVN